jgi:hypothetical protein
MDGADGGLRGEGVGLLGGARRPLVAGAPSIVYRAAVAAHFLLDMHF